MVVLTTSSSQGAGQFMRSVVRLCSCFFLTTLHISAPELRYWCSFCSLLLPAWSSIGVNRCCLESKITGAGASPDSLIDAPCGAFGCAPRMDLASRLRRNVRSSQLPTSLGSHRSSPPNCATTWTHGTWMAMKLSGTMPYVFVRVRSLASAALAFFMHRFCQS